MSDGFYRTLQKIPELKVIVHFILKVLKSVVKIILYEKPIYYRHNTYLALASTLVLLFQIEQRFIYFIRK